MSDAVVPHRVEPSVQRTHSGTSWLKRALDSDIFYSFRRSRMTMVAAAVTVLFFLLALFFAPLAGMIPGYATAPALLFVACMMARGLTEVDWEDVTEYTPAVVTALAMPLTFSIAYGIAFGFITYTLIKLLAGRHKELSIPVIVLAALFVLKFALV